MADLVVELYGTGAGVLRGTWRTFDFLPDPTAVVKFGIDSPILSIAIPLTVVAVRSRKERRQNFFHELLPEGRMLARLAQQVRVAEQDAIGLLRAYGRDVAGALQIWDPDIPGEPKQPALEPLSSAGVASLLEHVQDNPLGNRPAGGKTSLAGVQDKIVLARAESGWNQVIDGWPSTHILKPESRDYPTSIYDEEFGARFARATGLTSFPTWIEEFDGVPAVVIERYDRSPDAPQGRIHQEDFNQVLGAAGNQKYQKYGGKVSLERIARVFASLGDSDSLERLFKLVVVSVAVGNLDLHAKNVSLLHRPDGSMTLSPAYDVVPQAHQPNDGEVALAVDGEYRHAAITMEHLIAEGRAWGLATAADLAEEALTAVLNLASTEVPHGRAHAGLARDIGTFASNLLSGRAAGRPSADLTRGVSVLSLKAALKAVIAGDVTALNIVLEVPQDRLLAAADDMELVLTRESLAGVLRKLAHYQIDGIDAQRWASFIRRGFGVRQNGTPIMPITLHYQSNYEQQIVDIISRLDEIGDVVDGDIPSEDEISDYIALLGLTDID